MDHISPSGSSNDEPVPALPPELEQEIFEFTALAYPRFAPTLLLVSKRVRQWVEPKIYQVLVIRSDDDCRPPLYEFKDSIKQRTASWERVTAYAKHVLVQGVSASVAYEILQGCVNVKNLMLWSAEHRNLKQLIFSLPVERLSVNILELTGFDKDTTDTTGAGELEENFVFDHTYFVNLTHLDVVYVPKSVRSWDRWKNLALLPRLTHLSFYASTVDMVKNTLKECEKLKLLVLIFQEDVTEHGDEVGNGKFPSGIFDDCRVVQMADRPSDEWVEDWISGAHGKGDFWLEAEQMQKVQKIQKFLRNSSQNSVVEYVPMYETVTTNPSSTHTKHPIHFHLATPSNLDMQIIQEIEIDVGGSSSSGSPSAFSDRRAEPILPPELEREIFEVAASDFPRFAPTLALVAKRVQQWIEMSIYDVLVLQMSPDGIKAWPPLFDAHRSGQTKRSNFERATAYARHVYLTGIPASTAMEVLRSCVKVRNLELWDIHSDEKGVFNPLELEELIRSLPVERLSAQLPTMGSRRMGSPEFEFDHRCFVNLTHLDVSAMPRAARSWDKWRNLIRMPRLSHLALCAATMGMVEGILDGCERLEVLVLLWVEDLEDASLEQATRILGDKRVVRIIEGYACSVEGWIARAKGKTETFWTMAEQMQKKRQIEKTVA